MKVLEAHIRYSLPHKADKTAPNLNLSPEEKRTYGQLFRQADSDSVGVVVGEIAVRFFHKTGLDSRILGEVR
jgi:epidermal growth factor receptor substrate 15